MPSHITFTLIVMYSLPLNLLLRFYLWFLRFYLLSKILSLASVSVILICLGVTFINESLCDFLKFFFMWLFEILESVCFISFEKFLTSSLQILFLYHFLFFTYGSQVTGMLEFFNTSKYVSYSLFYILHHFYFHFTLCNLLLKPPIWDFKAVILFFYSTFSILDIFYTFYF